MSSLFVAWRPAEKHAGWRPVGRLDHDGGLYHFLYTQGAKSGGFHPFTGMNNLETVYESEELFPLFANRLLPTSRPEYEAFMRWSGFDPDNPPGPIVVLGVTEGIRQTDAVEVFPCPVPDSEGCYINKFFLHGIRWMGRAAVERMNRLQVNEPLKLLFDFQNTFDPQAVAVRTDDDRVMLGYVPRYLARDVGNLVNQCHPDLIEVTVASVNVEAPFQNRLLCQMKSCWPTGFQPCSGEEFRPIAGHVTSHFGT